MKKIVECSKVFDSHVRLQMIVELMKGSLTHKQLVEKCYSTSGAIATHTKTLLAEDFIVFKKQFVNNRPQTTYTLTEKGRKETVAYVQLLKETVLNQAGLQ